jgi:hypothetical protein
VIVRGRFTREEVLAATKFLGKTMKWHRSVWKKGERQFIELAWTEEGRGKGLRACGPPGPAVAVGPNEGPGPLFPLSCNESGPPLTGPVPLPVLEPPDPPPPALLVPDRAPRALYLACPEEGVCVISQRKQDVLAALRTSCGKAPPELDPVLIEALRAVGDGNVLWQVNVAKERPSGKAVWSIETIAVDENVRYEMRLRFANVEACLEELPEASRAFLELKREVPQLGEGVEGPLPIARALRFAKARFHVQGRTAVLSLSVSATAIAAAAE